MVFGGGFVMFLFFYLVGFVCVRMVVMGWRVMSGFKICFRGNIDKI